MRTWSLFYGKESRWVEIVASFPTYPPTLRIREACAIGQETKQ